VTAPERRSGIVCLAHERIATVDLHRQLVRAGVSCVIRGGSVRLSPHFYQRERQIDAFMNIVERL